jgi:hypothetical protein
MTRYPRQIPFFQSLTGSGAFALVIILLALTPFAVALEVHHALAAADHDNHQHSDSDLCQWVQDHTGSSLMACVPAVVSLFAISPHELSARPLRVCPRLNAVGPARAPPLS